MDYFRCSDCSHVFSQLEAGERPESETSEAWGQHSVTTTFYLTCPQCHRDELDHHEKCQTDGCLTEVMGDGLEDCAHCFAQADLDGFLEYLRAEGPLCYIEPLQPARQVAGGAK